MKAEIQRGEYAEDMPWELVIPYTYDGSVEYTKPCPHLVWTGDPVPQYRHDGTVFGHKRQYTLPGVAICMNEGGHNCTILCLGCLDDARRSATPPARQE